VIGDDFIAQRYLMSSEYTGLEAADWPKRIGAILTGVALVIGGLSAGIVVGSVATAFIQFIGIQTITTSPAYLVGTIAQGIGFGLTVLAFVLLRNHDDLIDLRWPTWRDLGWVIGGSITLLLTSMGASIVISQLGIEMAQHQIQQIGAENPELLLYMIVLAFLVIGPGEELLFRGAIQGALRRVYAPIPGILIASALFSLPHIIALAGATGSTPAYLAVVFVLGIVLGSIYEITDNLLVPAVVHGAYNAVTFISIYMMVT
jgi:membrane protease YdiL (CAAX protease family)